MIKAATKQAEDKNPLEFSFVFSGLNSGVSEDFKHFWAEHCDYFHEEINSYGTCHTEDFIDTPSLETPHNRNRPEILPAALARDCSGEIIGVVYVTFSEIDVSFLLGSHCYYQSMYIKKECRKTNLFRLVHPLYQTFLKGFLSEDCQRDCRAKYLLSKNVNPDLHKPASKRYFERVGFRTLGKHSDGFETWILPLETSVRKQNNTISSR